MKFLIMRMGGTFPQYAQKNGDFQDWTARAMGIGPDEWICADVKNGASLPSKDGLAGCVITGSHDMVTDKSLPYLSSTADWIRDALAKDFPIFGICFGHQLLAQATGGNAGPHPNGPEIGTLDIHRTPEAATDPLFSTMPEMFKGHTTHYQSALQLPSGAVILAKNAHDPHHAFRIGKHAWGVQFHPEFDADAMECYVEEQAEAIEGNGEDPSRLRTEIVETPAATSLLRRFVAHCRSLDN